MWSKIGPSYGGGRGGGGGGRFGREVVRRLTGVIGRLTGCDRSSDGAGEDDELELDSGCRSVVGSSRTWARLLVLTNEENSRDCGSIIDARLTGC